MPQPETPTRIAPGPPVSDPRHVHADCPFCICERGRARLPARPVSLELLAYEDADRLLRGPCEALAPIGRRWRLRAADRLAQKIETDLRGGRPPFSTEAAALAVLKETARDLRQAGEALGAAAQRLREKGDGLGANRAYMAGRAAAGAADGIDPD